MKVLLRSLVLPALLTAGGLQLRAQAPEPPTTVPPESIIVDDADNRRFRAYLEEKYHPLRARWAEWIRRADAFNFNFVGPKFTQGSAAAAAAAREQAWLNEELESYNDEAARFYWDVQKLTTDRERAINLMMALADRMKLSPAKIAQAGTVMRDLQLEEKPATSPAALAAIWRTVEARDGDAAMAAAAAAGPGPTLFNSGTQLSYNDCTIFALASAMGRPYGVVAAEALQLLRDADWRGMADRNAPADVLKREGLNGDEVTLLTAGYGQVELVPSAGFAPTLRDGRPVLVCVKRSDGKSVYLHQVVLSRTFQHHGETWFEMIDSHLAGSQRRYLSKGELTAVLKENGLAYRPDTGRTIPPLRF